VDPTDPALAGADLQAPVDIDLAYKDAKQALLDQFEAIYLSKLMARHEGNISQGARAAGLTRYHLRELLKKHDIHRG
jgi:DNA-binding NtrC family response regulator